MDIGSNTKSVINGLMYIRNPTEMIAVNTPPTSCTRPVPTKLRTPSTSFITLDTRAPDFWLSKNRVGSRSKCFCTLDLKTEIRCWASTLRILVNKNDVTAWIRIAIVSTVSSKGSLSSSLLTRISSIKGLVAQGGTSPATRLIMISINPIKRSFLRGQIIVLKTSRRVTLDLAMVKVEGQSKL